MKIEDQFRVDVPIETAWAVLLDVERIAPCMPGAELKEIEGDEFRGLVKVKVGPITAYYRGVAQIVETDEAAHRVVLSAKGRDIRGQGNASATITATLTEEGGETVVAIDTDLNVTGKVAQFGRGVMADVSARLLRQFVENLERDVIHGPPPAPPAAETVPDAAGIRHIDGPEAKPVDLFDSAAGPLARRIGPFLGGMAALLVLRVWRRRRRRIRARRRTSS
jgi:uncharacterized protein